MPEHPIADELIPTRDSLLSRLKDLDDQTSWRQFFNTYWKLIFAIAMKAGLSESEAQDVVQETVISISKHVAKFRYDPDKGSFKTWLYQLTRWRIIDHLRKRPGWATGERSVEATPEVLDRISAEGHASVEASLTEQMWDAEWRKNLVDQAMQRVKNKLSPKQYQIFDLSVVKEWPVADVTKVLKVNRGQVYLARHRVGALIRKEMGRLETQME